ncbi:MAG: hypothetical protein AB2L20_33000 [Mangrovibacterium sp.]
MSKMSLTFPEDWEGINRLRKAETYSGLIKCVLLLVIAPVFVWQLSLEKTVSLYFRNRQAEAQGTNLRTRKGEDWTIPIPKVQESYISTGKILDTIGLYTVRESVSILGYTRSLTGSEGNFNLYTGVLILRGDYIALLRTVNRLERCFLYETVILGI